MNAQPTPPYATLLLTSLLFIPTTPAFSPPYYQGRIAIVAIETANGKRALPEILTREAGEKAKARERSMNTVQIIQIIQNFLNSPNTGFGTGILGPLQPLLIKFMGQTPLELTTGNPVVMNTWGIILALANAFFLLLVLLGTIHIMVSQTTGTLTLPLSQFLPKIIVTALLMNLSAFFGQTLLSFNNELCGAINANFDGFFNTINNGTRVTQGQGLLLYLGVLILLNITLIRLLFQAFERVALWILLFVLSSLAFLFAFLPQTSPVFSYWGRMFVVVTFTQFVQLLTFTIGLSLLARAGLTGLSAVFLALAMLLLVAKIPDLLARFPSMALQGSQGIGQLLGSIIIGARLLAA